MAICWERAGLFSLRLCGFTLYCLNCFGAWDKMWDSIVSILDRCLFIYYQYRKFQFQIEPFRLNAILKILDVFQLHIK